MADDTEDRRPKPEEPSVQTTDQDLTRDRDGGSKEPQGRKDKNDDPSDGDGDGDPEDDPKTKRQKLIVIVVLVVIASIGVVLGVIWWLHARNYEKTNDAFVDTKITHVAPRASGEVAQVFVSDNQAIQAGQLLVQLDDSAARMQLAQAEASRAQALSQIAQAEAQVQVASAQLEQSQANTRGPAAQAGKSERDYRRYLGVSIATPAAVAPLQLDQAQTTAVNDDAQFASAQKQVKTSRAQLASSRTQLGSGQAQLQTAQAQIAQAQLQIAYARVVASVDGHVANRTVAVGNYAQPGSELMSIVPNRLWITANFKETQLARMRVGQSVDVKIDAYPAAKFPGHIESIQRGAGQSFSVLPAQNATGNFVKVVQRVPVKIVLDRVDAIRFPLGPGMSVEPSVRVN